MQPGSTHIPLRVVRPVLHLIAVRQIQQQRSRYTLPDGSQQDFGNDAVVLIFANEQWNAPEVGNVRPPFRKPEVHSEGKIGTLAKLTESFHTVHDVGAALHRSQ